ncbi:MAG: hypothetical protein K2O04_07150 [Clostridiales bacterium]|nr:hypothetical protein [Clostridiales bacterium]
MNNVILRKRVFSEEHEKFSDKAYKLYEQLIDILNDEQIKVYNEYVDAEIKASSEAETVYFREGLKTGLLLAMECLA